MATVLDGTTTEHSRYCRKFSWAVSLRKNWENPSTFNKKEGGGGGVGLRGRAASKHLMDIESEERGRRRRLGTRGQSGLKEVWLQMNLPVWSTTWEWVVKREEVGPELEGPAEWDFRAWRLYFFWCRSVSCNCSALPPSHASISWSLIQVESLTGDRDKNGHKIMPGWCSLHPQGHGWQFSGFSQFFPIMTFKNISRLALLVT